MIGYHCDAEDCDSWAFKDMTVGWVTVSFSRPLIALQDELHFCCKDCCGKHMLANSSPTETV